MCNNRVLHCHNLVAFSAYVYSFPNLYYTHLAAETQSDFLYLFSIPFGLKIEKPQKSYKIKVSEVYIRTALHFPYLYYFI